MLIIDGHNDTLGKWTDGVKETHFQKKEIRDKYIQIFAAFCGEDGDKWARVNRLIDTYDGLTGYYKITERCGLAKRFLHGAVLSVEGGDCIGHDIKRLYCLAKRNVMMLTLTWNTKNDIACGALEENDTGLTPFGREVVSVCERVGITVDLSHMAEKSFYDCIDFANKPIVLSHSNSRTVCDNPRNITDEQFKAVVKNGGVVGINFYPPFLTGGDATIDDILRHIDRFLSLGGENNIGIGSDFDGIKLLPENIGSTKDIYTLIERLSVLYSPRVADKIAGTNFLRILSGNLR